MKELGMMGPSARLNTGKPPVPVAGVAAAATANNTDISPVRFMLIAITRQGGGAKKESEM